jgi:CTP:molybdopterin cytidylyltransferase MocA
MLADMPFVPESHVRALLARLDPADPKSMAFSLGGGAERGWRGPPAAFGAGWLAELAHADGDQGARPILRNVPESCGVRASSAWLADFDTPADFASAGHTETLP